MYLVSTYWRGSMRIADSQVVKTLDKAKEYLWENHRHSAESGFFRIYKMTFDKPLELVRFNFKDYG